MGVEIAIRLTPRASKEGVHGIYTDAKGDDYLKVSVTAPAEDYKANAALIEVLAKRLRLPKYQFSIRKGATFRSKIIFVEGGSDLERDSLEKLGSAKS